MTRNQWFINRAMRCRSHPSGHGVPQAIVSSKRLHRWSWWRSDRRRSGAPR
jgi:hypothetical protein